MIRTSPPAYPEGLEHFSSSEETVMHTRRNDGLVYIALLLAAGAAVLSSPAQPSAALQAARYLIATSIFDASISDQTIAAAALGDVRYFDVPP
jgi:hypothetical protein